MQASFFNLIFISGLEKNASMTHQIELNRSGIRCLTCRKQDWIYNFRINQRLNSRLKNWASLVLMMHFVQSVKQIYRTAYTLVRQHSTIKGKERKEGGGEEGTAGEEVSIKEVNRTVAARNR